MKLMDVLLPEAILLGLESRDKEGAINEFTLRLAQKHIIKDEDRQSVCHALTLREKLGSSGIGRKVAVPHTKWPGVERLIVAFGTSADGIEWQSLDGEPVELVFLLVSPPDRPGDHLRALELLSQVLRDDIFCRFLRQSKTVKDVIELATEWDADYFGE